MKRLLLLLAGGLMILGACAEDEESEAPVEETETVEEEEQEEPEEVEETEPKEEEENGLPEEDLAALEEGLVSDLEASGDDLTVHTFDYEDNQIDVWVDMQNDPMPTKIEAEDILAGVTWYLAELNDVVENPEYDVNALLVSDADDGMIHWLTERYSDGEYDMQEQDAFDILPN